MELYHNATALQTSLLGRLKWLFVGINAFLYLFLIIVVAVYAARVNKKEIALCGDSGSRDEASINLTKCVPVTRNTVQAPLLITRRAYKVIVSAVAFVLAMGFMIYGTILLHRMTGLAHNARDKLIKFALVAVACTIGLLLQCALLLYSTFKKSGSSTSTIVAIVLVLIVELLPGGILLATIRQPRAEGTNNPDIQYAEFSYEETGVDTWWQDFIWCFYLKASAETLSSRRRTSNSQRPTSATTEGVSNTPTASHSGIESGAPTSKF